MNYYYPPHYEQPQQSSYYQLASEDFDLKIRQQPKDALLAQDGREKARKPVDPPPIIEVTVREAADPIRQFLQSPYLFMTCTLVPGDEGFAGQQVTDAKGLCGTMVSSLHKLKDINNTDGGFFVFGDVSVKRVGEHKLLFSLFEMRKNDHEVTFLKSVYSDVFTVHPQKEYPGLEESTHLSRTFADQGVRLRLRKEARTMGGATGRKRSHPQAAQGSQGGSSRQPTMSRTQSGYMSSPVVPSAYGEYGEPNPKRSRLELAPFGAYQPGGQGIPSQSSMPNLGSYQGGYQSPTPMSRLQPQTVPSQSSTVPSRYSQYYGQGSISGPSGATDLSLRSASFSRYDQGQGPQQTPTSMPMGGYDRGPGLAYGTAQQGSGGMPQLSNFQAPSAAGSSAINPPGPGYQAQQMSYGSVPDASAYSSYPQGSQYRNDQNYQPSTLGQQSYSPDGQLQQQYGDVSQGYASSYDPNDRSGYNTSGRSWS